MHSNKLNPSRRTALALGAGALGAALLPLKALALTTSGATSLVERVVADTLKVVNSSSSDAQAIATFERLLAKYADVGVIARAVLGQPWRSASSAQKQAYTRAFQGYVSRKYGKQFREFRGAKMQIRNAKDFGNKGVVVNTVISVPGRAPVVVDWQISDRSGSPKVLDIIVEGIRMISTERTEVRAILGENRNNLDALIADLNKRG